ncbi:uncharacterized protein [Dysidea avara]|uniref:uncharacterized protein n=1 Tax=Dysidea avara TaxID=196820 RepID=UPI00333069D2
MSGPIRKIIGPAKARLQQYIESANGLLENKPKEQELDEYESEVEDFLNRLTTNVSLLEKCNKDWSNVLKEAKGDAKATEEKEYSRATDGETGFIELMFAANEVISRLKARVTLISRKREQANYQKMLTSTQTNLQPIIDHATVQATREVQAATLTSSSSGDTFTVNNPQLSVHLPKLHLPIFDGNLLKWPEFWDIFHSSVHKQKIPNVSKFSYLKGTLRGVASVAISGISVTEENYDVALKLLKERFGRKESIVEVLYAKLQNLPTSSCKFSDIQYTHNNIERILRQLESQGETVDNQRMLVYQILSKFPLEVILKLESTKQCDEEWTMELLRQLLSRYVIVQENAYRRVANAKGRNYDYRPVRHEGGQKESQSLSGGGKQLLNQASVDTFTTNVQRRGRSPSCVFCRGDHFNDECDRVKTLAERKRKLITQGRCFLCFKVGHTFTDCSSPQRYGCYYCGKKQHHNRAICPQRFGDGEVRKNVVPDHDVGNVVTEGSQDKPTETLNASVGTDHALIASGEKVLLQTAVVPIQTADGSATIMAKVLLDSASHRTFITDQLAKKLKLTCDREELLSISTFAARTPQQVNTFVVHFNVITKNNSCLPLHANVINKITGPIQRGPIQPSDLEFLLSISPEKMADTVPKDVEPVNVDLLIGSDYFWTILGTEKLTLPSGLFLISSKIGYILTGKYSIRSCQQHVSSCLVMTEVNKMLPEMSMVSCSDDSVTCIEDFWRLETIGISDPLDITDDDKALERFNSSICFEDGRYQIQWPWKYENLDIPENLDIAVGRLRSLARRFQKDRNLLEKYDEVISSQVKQGIVEKVTTDTRTSQQCHYLPHHPVITPAKSTTKLRIVYDASTKAKRGEKSLNECLHRGPVLLPDLCGILLRFRIQPIVMLADIEKAFLQVGIQEMDRDVTRFLWFKNLQSLEVVEENLDVYRFCRVPFGIICSPFLLGGTIKYHLKKIGTPVASQISENIYVDNVLLGAGTVKEAHKIYFESKNIFGKASMNLREWISNSSEFLGLLPETEVVKGSVVKTFGMPWNYKEDNLQVGGVNFSNSDVIPTKREVLKVVAKVFDPLGLVTPVTFYGKVFLQVLWMESVSWDEPLSEELCKRWNEI